MGIWDTITDLVEAATPWGAVEAEAPAKEEEEPQVRAPPQPGAPARASGQSRVSG